MSWSLLHSPLSCPNNWDEGSFLLYCTHSIVLFPVLDLWSSHPLQLSTQNTWWAIFQNGCKECSTHDSCLQGHLYVFISIWSSPTVPSACPWSHPYFPSFTSLRAFLWSLPSVRICTLVHFSTALLAIISPQCFLLSLLLMLSILIYLAYPIWRVR